MIFKTFFTFIFFLQINFISSYINFNQNSLSINDQENKLQNLKLTNNLDNNLTLKNNYVSTPSLFETSKNIQNWLDFIQEGYEYRNESMRIYFIYNELFFYKTRGMGNNFILNGTADFSSDKFKNLEKISFTSFTGNDNVEIINFGKNNQNLKTFIFNGFKTKEIKGTENLEFIESIDLSSNSFISDLDFSEDLNLQKFFINDNNSTSKIKVKLPLSSYISLSKKVNIFGNNNNITFEMIKYGKNFFPFEEISKFKVFYKEEALLQMNDDKSLLLFEGFNWFTYWKTGEKFSYEENGKLKEERKIFNWFKFKSDFFEKGELKIKNFIYWSFEDFQGYNWIIPLWWEFIEGEKEKKQDWIDKLKPGDGFLSDNGRSLVINNSNVIGKIDLSGDQFQELEYIDLSGNKISEIDLTSNYYLIYLKLINNNHQLKIKLNWSFDQEIDFFRDDHAIIEQEKRKKINAQNWLDKREKKDDVTYLQGSNLNLVGKINFLNFPNLTSLFLFNNNLTEIDVSLIEKDLINLWVDNNPNAKIIFLNENQKNKILNFKYNKEGKNKQEIKYFFDLEKNKKVFEKGKKYFDLSEEKIRNLSPKELKKLLDEIYWFEHKNDLISIPDPIAEKPSLIEPWLPIPIFSPLPTIPYWSNIPSPVYKMPSWQDLPEQVLLQKFNFKWLWLSIILLLLTVFGIIFFRKINKKFNFIR